MSRAASSSPLSVGHGPTENGVSSPEEHPCIPFLLPWETSGMEPKILSAHDPFVLAPTRIQFFERRAHEAP